MESIRNVIETLKWLDFADVLTCSLVSALFSKASLSEEMWMNLCDLHDITEHSQGQRHIDLFRSNYPRLFLLFSAVQVSFYCSTRKWKELSRVPLRADWNSAWTLVGWNLLVSGGNSPNSSEAWRYSQNTQTVTELQPMREIRAGHALVTYKSVVYAFGGAAAPQTCEKFDGAHWTQMAAMCFPHSWFSAAQRNHLVFLCGGMQTRCEVFNALTEVCTRMDVELPTNTESSACVYGDKLVVIQRGSATEVCNDRIERTVSRISWGSSWTNMSPLVASGYVFLPRQDAKCVRALKLSDLTTVEVLQCSSS